MNISQAQAEAIHAAGLKRVRTTPPPRGQKYLPGTRVRIADDLGPAMSHFPKAKNATVLYTYAHAYGGSNAKDYCLVVDGVGEISWYAESQLAPLEACT